MTTFARLIPAPNSGEQAATDLCYGDDINVTVAAAFAPAYVAEPPGGGAWQEVPDLDTNGLPLVGGSITVDGGATFTNSVAQKPPAQPLELSGVQFHGYCAGALAAANASSAEQGMDRLGIIVRAMRLAVADAPGMIEIAYQRYTAAAVPGGKYSLSDTTTLMAVLVSTTIITAREGAAIIAGWPTN